jgi:hypothetical protein
MDKRASEVAKKAARFLSENKGMLMQLALFVVKEWILPHLRH